jgi:hypothetical protein
MQGTEIRAIFKMAVFWVVASCTLVQFTDVSEMITASTTIRPHDEEERKHF